MKKIINGKKYNTETATMLGSWDNGIYGDLDSVSETLYRKKNGEYFVHGEGGPRTQYCEVIGNTWYNGEAIIPMDYKTAREWAEEHLSVEEYEAAFGEVDESDETVTITVRIPAATKAALEREQSRTGKTTQTIVCELLAALQ